MNRILSFILFLTFLTAGCTYTMKIREGSMAYERKQYAVAVSMLPDELKKEKSRIEKGKLAYMLAESYRQLNRSEDAVEWYQTAYDYGYGVDALQGLAYTLKEAERYEEAIEAFKNLSIEIGSPYEYRREINACEVAQGWKKTDRVEYQVEPLTFNTSAAEYAPFRYKGGKLIFTSDRSSSSGTETYNWTGREFSDLFVYDLETGAVEPFDATLNTPNNEGTVSFSPDFKEIYFTRCFAPPKQDAYCRIMTSEYINDSWSIPRALDFQEDGVNYTQPAVSSDGQYLFFAADHPDGWGGFDIYVCERQGADWSAPRLLGRSINTEGNEQFPYADADTLYFASDRHTGMGGLDIFRSYRMANDNWAPPFNLKPPINSGADDFAYTIDRSTDLTGKIVQAGYFTSSRKTGAGNDDIYRFEKVELPPLPPPPVVEVDYRLELEIYVLEKIYQDPTDPNSRILGRRPLPGSDIEIAIGDRSRTVTADEEGKYLLEMAQNTNYQFLGAKEGYLKNTASFSTRGIGQDPLNPVQRFEVEIVLDKIFFDREIVLENIYYDFDEFFIRDDAKPTLDQLAADLALNPGIRIEMGSHTDCRGNDAYNLDLSQKRAQAAVDYLITKGIDPARLSAKGYGETEPAVDCICSRCTEEQHQANRRTSFKIVGSE